MNCKKVANHITNELKKYAVDAGVKGYVIGVSGGIDSAVVSELCAETGLNISCCSLPIRQHKNQVDLAEKQLEYLNKKFCNVITFTHDLTKVFNAFEKDAAFSNTDTALAFANTRSRLRMVFLYHYANSYGRLVAGTGNKVEDFGIGFCTKYGDSAVDISPIGNLLKSQVWELGKYMGTPQEIIDAKPTDGLWDDGRSDEDAIGATYKELEWAMRLYERDLISPSVVLETANERQKQAYKIFQKRHAANAHKMKMPPIIEIPEKFMED